jgi:uncharacterized protein YacL (UPF0231 family)
MSEEHEALKKELAKEVEALNASIDSVEDTLEAHEATKAAVGSEGHVALSNDYNSSSESVAATSKAVKDAHDSALESAKAYADSKFGTVAEAMNFKGSAGPSEL